MFFLFSATFALDHFHLMGLSQGLGVDINKALGMNAETKKGGLAVRLHYSIVAHPIMTGFLLMNFGTPIMTAPRMMLAVVNSMYCILATKCIEEPHLEKLMGNEYTNYLRTVPSFCPLFGPARPETKSRPKIK